ncbi:dihydrofolate reductase family protein [Microbacterium aureliae]
MARIVYGMLVSLDGFVADPEGVITLPVPGRALHQYFNDLQHDTAVSVYGRRMWQMMRYWGEPDPDRDAVAEEFARAWAETPKVVVSRTLADAPEGVRLIREDPVGAIGALATEVDGVIEVSGPELAASLGRAGLIDEYRLYTQPVVLGEGLPYFATGFRPELTLVGVETLPDEVVLTRYAPVDPA